MLREMNERDVLQVVGMFEDIHRVSEFRELGWSPVKAANVLQEIIALPNGFAIVYEIGKQIKGFTLGIYQQHWIGVGLMASDMTIYVDPGYRGTMAAARMIKAYEKWAAGHGVVYIGIGINTGIEVERSGKLCEKLGYKFVGGNYRKIPEVRNV